LEEEKEPLSIVNRTKYIIAAKATHLKYKRLKKSTNGQ
jgi:hypothetical protein